VGLSGCAGMAAAKAERARLERELDTARCPRTLDESWDEARRMLAERGYPLGEADSKAVGKVAGFFERGGTLGSLLTRVRDTHDEGSYRVLETSWVGPRRYRLVGSPGAPGCHVTFLAIQEDEHEPLRDAWEAPRRDLELEQELLGRLTPAPAPPVAAPAPAGSEPHDAP
jgi:hypothetical protein